MNLDKIKHFIRGDKLVIDIEYSGAMGVEFWQGKVSTRPKRRYVKTERWSSEKASELYRQGYRKAKGFKSELIHLRCPVFVKFIGFYKFDVKAMDKPHLDTASSQYDFFSSTATKDFERGLAKKKMSELDQKSIIMIIIVIAGVALGMFMMR